MDSLSEAPTNACPLHFAIACRRSATPTTHASCAPTRVSCSRCVAAAEGLPCFLDCWPGCGACPPASCVHVRVCLKVTFVALLSAAQERPTRWLALRGFCCTHRDAPGGAVCRSGGSRYCGLHTSCRHLTSHFTIAAERGALRAPVQSDTGPPVQGKHWADRRCI